MNSCPSSATGGGALWGVGLGVGLVVVIYLVVSNAWFRAGDRR